jgi:hypothetical protein
LSCTVDEQGQVKPQNIVSGKSTRTSATVCEMEMRMKGGATESIRMFRSKEKEQSWGWRMVPPRHSVSR